jgi:hypothetical protein
MSKSNKDIWTGLKTKDYEALDLYVKYHKIAGINYKIYSRLSTVEKEKLFNIPIIRALARKFKTDTKYSENILQAYEEGKVFDPKFIEKDVIKKHKGEIQDLKDDFNMKLQPLEAVLQKLKDDKRQAPKADKKKIEDEIKKVIKDIKDNKEKLKLDIHVKDKDLPRQIHEGVAEKMKLKHIYEKEIKKLFTPPPTTPEDVKIGDSDKIIDIKNKLATETSINPEDQTIPSTQPNETAVNRAEHVENKELKKQNIMNTGLNNVNQKKYDILQKYQNKVRDDSFSSKQTKYNFKTTNEKLNEYFNREKSLKNRVYDSRNSFINNYLKSL